MIEKKIKIFNESRKSYFVAKGKWYLFCYSFFIWFLVHLLSLQKQKYVKASCMGKLPENFIFNIERSKSFGSYFDLWTTENDHFKSFSILVGMLTTTFSRNFFSFVRLTNSILIKNLFSSKKSGRPYDFVWPIKQTLKNIVWLFL